MVNDEGVDEKSDEGEAICRLLQAATIGDGECSQPVVAANYEPMVPVSIQIPPRAERDPRHEVRATNDSQSKPVFQSLPACLVLLSLV